MLIEKTEEWKPTPVYVVEFNSRQEEVKRQTYYAYPDADCVNIDMIRKDTFVRHWDLSGMGKSMVSYEDAIHNFEVELK